MLPPPPPPALLPPPGPPCPGPPELPPAPPPPLPAPPAPLALAPAPKVMDLFICPMEPVIPAMPSSMNTMGAPSHGKHGPQVLRLTISLSVPGSFPWHLLMHPPTVRILAPSILVRMHGSVIPSMTDPKVGYGIGNGAGAAGVRQTLTASPVCTWPDLSVMVSKKSAVTLPMAAQIVAWGLDGYKRGAGRRSGWIGARRGRQAAGDLGGRRRCREG
ncbi:MAG: hypothetical protein QM820_33270 [Minicystis sp.]